MDCDNEFYFEDLYLLVQGKLFKVLRRTFEDNSEVFKDMFLLPAGSGQSTREGKDPEHPIRLEGVDVDDMIQLLRVLYPRHFEVREVLTCAEWVSVLRLATQWQFAAVRSRAITALHALTDPIDKILLHDDPRNALDSEAKTWLIPAVRKLIEKTGGLSVEEGNRMGVELVLRVYFLRETYIVVTARYRGFNAEDAIMKAWGLIEDQPE